MNDSCSSLLQLSFFLVFLEIERKIRTGNRCMTYRESRGPVVTVMEEKNEKMDTIAALPIPRRPRIYFLDLRNE